MILFKTYYENSILLSEGGNAFKEETQPIESFYVIPTIKNLEKLIGRPLLDNTLGSTAKKKLKELSGDIDLVIKGTQEDKYKFKNELIAKGIPPESLKIFGIEVAYKAPVVDERGNKIEGRFVQVDFMFSEHPEFLKFYYANNEDVHKGSARNILLSSIAKEKGLKLSMKGLSDGDINPETITRKILGDDATLNDIYNVKSILTYLKKHYSEEEIKTIVSPAEETIGAKLVYDHL